MKYKIIVDSSSDMHNDEIKDSEVGFEVVPLTINVENKEYIDDGNIDCNEMLDRMHQSKLKSTTSCPSPQSFLEACEADYNFIITITSKLSGTYNSAILASNLLKGKKCFVIDSKATSGTITLIVYKILELIKEDKSYEEICDEILRYREERKFFFILDDFDNLIKNGRMKKMTAMIAKLMFIKPLCIAQDGEIKIYEKVRTRKLAVNKLISEILKDSNSKDVNRCIITHCFDLETANYIGDELKQKSKFSNITIRDTAGLCSFYALKKGILIAY